MKTQTVMYVPIGRYRFCTHTPYIVYIHKCNNTEMYTLVVCICTHLSDAYAYMCIFTRVMVRVTV